MADSRNADRHKTQPVSVRLSKGMRDWLTAHAATLEDPAGNRITLHRLIIIALWEYRERNDYFYKIEPDDPGWNDETEDLYEWEPSVRRYRTAPAPDTGIRPDESGVYDITSKSVRRP